MKIFAIGDDWVGSERVLVMELVLHDSVDDVL